MKRDARKPTVWDRLGPSQDASKGYDLVANILVGLGLGWLAQRYLGVPQPWGMVGGLVLGSASGFYQLFRGEAVARKPEPGPDRGKDGGGDRG